MARWVSFLLWPRGRLALLAALAALLSLAADASLSLHPRAAALLCASALFLLGAALAQDASTAQLDAAEAAEARGYAPEVAIALTRRALPRAAGAAAALVGGAVAGGAAAVFVTTPVPPGPSHVAAVVAGLCLMLAALLLQIWDAFSLGREVAAANGTTPPSFGGPSNAPMRARAGLAGALALLVVAASVAGAGGTALASLLADAVRISAGVQPCA
jgi:hypothetical protein